MGVLRRVPKKRRVERQSKRSNSGNHFGEGLLDCLRSYTNRYRSEGETLTGQTDINDCSAPHRT